MNVLIWVGENPTKSMTVKNDSKPFCSFALALCGSNCKSRDCAVGGGFNKKVRNEHRFFLH